MKPSLRDVDVTVLCARCISSLILHSPGSSASHHPEPSAPQPVCRLAAQQDIPVAFACRQHPVPTSITNRSTCARERSTGFASLSRTRQIPACNPTNTCLWHAAEPSELECPTELEASAQFVLARHSLLCYLVTDIVDLKSDQRAILNSPFQLKLKPLRTA